MRVALLCLVFVVGCQVKNPHFCPRDEPCVTVDVLMKCDSNDDCSAGVCDTAAGVCVGCLMNTDCDVAAPICTMKKCSKCTQHSQCDSKVCLPDGATGGQCAPANMVSYVAGAGGNDNGMCSAMMPCRTILHAMDRGRPYVKIQANVDEALLIDGRTITIFADPSTRLTRSGGGGAIVDIKGAANVEIHDLEISDAIGGGASSSGVIVSGTPTVRFAGVTINGNEGRGLFVNAGTVTVERSTISENLTGGIEVTSAAKIVITNNLIVNNGKNTGTNQSNVGGVSLAGISDTIGSRFSFNTVVQNVNTSGSVLVAGVSCGVTDLDAGGNIAYVNQRGTANDLAQQTAGGCNFGNTFRSGPVAGDLGFNLATATYRLVATSPATVRDVEGTCPPEDIDRQMRPYNMKCDLGADEFVP